jgi:hypothetical protein
MASMDDLEIRLDDRPGTLAEMGAALGRAGLSIEGGGGFAIDGCGIMHFLFHNGAAARRVLEGVRIDVRRVSSVVSVRLRQAQPGQLGTIARAMAEANVNIQAVYSDHTNRLIMVVDRFEAGERVARAWTFAQASWQPA